MTEPIGIIGGSGLYSLLPDAREVTVETPFGPTSDPIVMADISGREIAFVPRHGRDHRWPPHRVPYQANLWALHSLGVRQIVAPCAVGSLDPAIGPGTLVIPDQIIDRTTRRPTTMWDGLAVHVPFADPYCPRGRQLTIDVAKTAGWDVVERGTMVVIEGPRFSSRAESAGYAAMGATIINMTGMPEAALARELGICYTAAALVTDRDAGIDSGDSVTMAEVLSVFAAKTAALRALLITVANRLDHTRTCRCGDALLGTPAEGKLISNGAEPGSAADG